jgi:Uncharacterized FAD-dependent dehydrogenases
MKLKNSYDVIIIGAGPAGIFTALEIVQNSALKVLIIEKGKDIEKRRCPMEQTGRCINCPVCNILSGWGGAGAYSDGKLNLSPDIGGFLGRYINRQNLIKLIEYVDKIYLKYGAPDKVYEPDIETVENIKARAIKNGLIFVPSKIRHIGTEKCFEVLKALKKRFIKKG